MQRDEICGSIAEKIIGSQKNGDQGKNEVDTGIDDFMRDFKEKYGK
jgi:hypothetical protein